MKSPEQGEVLRKLVQRTDLHAFAERILDSFWGRDEFHATRPPRRELHMWVRWNLDLVIRWLVDGQPPDDSELEVFRSHAQARVEDGTPMDFVPANFRRGARFAWNALLDVATEDERRALVGTADLLFEYVDRVSRIYADAYESAAISTQASPEERLSRALLHRLCHDETLLAEHVQLAGQLGFKIEGAFRPFVIAAPGPPGQHHAALATRLRLKGALAVSEGRWVAGLANCPVRHLKLDLGAATITAEGTLTAREELGRALEELRMVVGVARGHGHTGAVEIRDYLPDLLLRSAPRIAAQVRNRVFGPLRFGHPELARTLTTLVAHDFSRPRTAAALPVHRNTLRDRLSRITELTGIDLDRGEDRVLAWLACRGAPDLTVAADTDRTA